MAHGRGLQFAAGPVPLVRTPDAERIGLPPRPFLYTLDQIAVLLNMPEGTLRAQILFFEGRSFGAAHPSQIKAHNIAAETKTPDWRVVEREFIRWMKRKGYKYYDRSSFSG